MSLPASIAVGNHAHDGEITDLQACTAAWLAGHMPAITDFDGADPTGKQDSSNAFSNAFGKIGANALYVPAGTYRVDAGGVSLASGASLIGAGLNATRINYAGSGAAILLDGCIGSTVARLLVVTSDSSATVRGIHLKNTTLQSKWNDVLNCQVVQNNATGRIAGQVGILMEDNSSSVVAQFWNTVRGNKLLNWETCMAALQSGGGADGVNQSFWISNMCAAFLVGLRLPGRCNDHVVSGLFGTHSSGSVFTDVLLDIGEDAGTDFGTGNQCSGIVSDMGANGSAFKLRLKSQNNYVRATNESSGADIDLGTTNDCASSKNISGATQRVRIPTLQVPGVSSFSGNLSTGSGLQLAKRRAVADQSLTLNTSDFIVAMTSISAARTWTLPSASAFSGGWLRFKDESGSASGANTITALGAGGNTVDGAASVVAINAAYGHQDFYSNGSNWFTI